MLGPATFNLVFQPMVLKLRHFIRTSLSRLALAVMSAITGAYKLFPRGCSCGATTLTTVVAYQKETADVNKVILDLFVKNFFLHNAIYYLKIKVNVKRDFRVLNFLPNSMSWVTNQIPVPVAADLLWLISPNSIW